MVTIKGRRVLDSGVGKAALAGGALVAVGGAVALAAGEGASSTVLALSTTALVGAVGAWLQAASARRAAEKASSDLDAVAGRLIQLEDRLAQAAQGDNAPGLRTTVAEVTGEIGLLGGIVRDLAETVAAQDREVADLKQHLKRPAASEPARPLAQQVPARPAPDAPPASPRVAVKQPADVPVPPQHEPSLLPIPRKEPAIPDAEARRMAAIVQAFEADRIELHLQPVVALPQRKVRSYEALARMRLADETILVPAEFLPLLERLGHAAEFDRRVLVRAIAIARHLVARGSEAIISVNLSPRSLQEPGFLRSVGRLFDAYPDTVGKVVLELSQRCWRTLDAERAGSLAALRDKGVPFALDRASDLRLDPLALADRGVRFVKLPADLMIAADHGRGLDIEVNDLSSVLRRAGIKLVAERVEREEIVPDLIDLDVPLAQGFVFAAPRAVRAEVLNASPQAEPQPVETAPPPPPPPAPEAAAAEERLPFRAFLRRAG
jgi:cyclic-di-GMP phosphodiesterase TipF (flagellum assembly factor)